MASRKRTTSLEVLQAKADNLRSMSFEDVDRDLSDLGKNPTKTDKKHLERTPEDDEAIAEAIADVEHEIVRDSSWYDIMNLVIVMVAVLGGMFYIQSQLK